MAAELVKHGYRDAGYVHINIDDCWSKRDGRDKDGRLVPDPKRFPHGIKWLVQYVSVFFSPDTNETYLDLTYFNNL